MRRVSVLGATGSIGRNTLDLIARTPDEYDVIALTGGRNIALLADQARRLRAQVAVTAHDDLLDDLRTALAGSGIEAGAGTDALNEAAARPADWVMSAIIGMAGLKPGLAAMAEGNVLALANKESLVTAGPLVMAAGRAAGCTVLPVDSEHSAIFQALTGEDASRATRVIITASGGAFRDWPLEDLARATVDEASAHPNWNMGQRITIDSASMFNKAMEVIETHEFFGFSSEQIEVLVHPESIVHALVGFCDGGLMAHVGPPDMRHAIGYALHWPERRDLPIERLDLARIGQLSFRAPDPARYPALDLARQVMQEGGLAGAAFNAAKERALDHFIAGRIGFTDMQARVAETLDSVLRLLDGTATEITLETVGQADHLTRQQMDRLIAARAG